MSRDRYPALKAREAKRGMDRGQRLLTAEAEIRALRRQLDRGCKWTAEIGTGVHATECGDQMEYKKWMRYCPLCGGHIDTEYFWND